MPNPRARVDSSHLPCGCTGWAVSGVESYMICENHLQIHAIIHHGRMEETYAVVGVDDTPTVNRMGCPCILCLTKAHGFKSPYQFAKFVVKKGIEETIAKQRLIIQEDTTKKRRARNTVRRRTAPCGCRWMKKKGEWRITGPCTTHKKEPISTRRGREKEYNERYDA